MTKVAKAMRYYGILVPAAMMGLFSSEAKILISEVAYRGGGDVCNGKDWIELVNTDTTNRIDLNNYTIHDDKGPDDEDATLLAGEISPGEFVTLCRDQDFAFGIGGDDTVTLLDATAKKVDEVTLPGEEYGTTVMYAYFDDGDYKYTSTATPSASNVYTEPITQEQKYTAQNNAGEDFFSLSCDNDNCAYSKVVDISITVPNEGMIIINNHPAWEEWVSFDGLSISNANNDTFVSSSSGGGRIRVKGQSTNTITTCLGYKNTPFNIEFDTPFLGMVNMYLRNHLTDYSYMREHSAHTMLKAFGLPYLRTRPVRLFLNGNYIGFYTLMEAPSQGYVMQRSFGKFDPDKTAIFKAKTFAGFCPKLDALVGIFIDPEAVGQVEEKAYYKRGSHRDDTPVIEDSSKCYDWFLGEIGKELTSVYNGVLQYESQCGKAMVELGRIDRDFGPKSMEKSMISFLDDQFFNTNITDLSDFVDVDQWLQNLATYSIMLNLDSPVGVVANNWYLAATTEGGKWKIVQYDHNNMASQSLGDICDTQCSPRLVYWPLLRPTCEAIESNNIVGRLLHKDENVQKYLNYVEEYMTIMESNNIMDQLYEYGHTIKNYAAEDPFFTATFDLTGANADIVGFQTVADYEEEELGRNTSNYNSRKSPFLKTLSVRLKEVRKQLDAIEAGTLPRNGVYDTNSVCPDWRDDNFEDYVLGTTVSKECALDDCLAVGQCYDNSPFSCLDGNLIIPDCQPYSPKCDSCFPYSDCGTGSNKNPSNAIVESKSDCEPDLATQCASASKCFSHRSGHCAFDGEILTVECQRAAMPCKACFPNSRCGIQKDDGNSGASGTTIAAMLSWMILAVTYIHFSLC